MINIAVCDDMKTDRQTVINLVNGFCKKNDIDYKISEFENGADLLEHFQKNIADIIFLDIYLKNENGIEIARELNKLNFPHNLVLTTQSREHALDGYRVHAVNYLTKPIESDVFEDVFSRLIKNVSVEKQKKLYIKTGDCHSAVSHNEILYIESDAKKVNVHTIHNSTLSSYAKLDQIQNELNDDRFLRCHKSFLINMDYVNKISNNLFFLKDNHEVPIKQKDFVNMRKRYWEYISGKISIDD